MSDEQDRDEWLRRVRDTIERTEMVGGEFEPWDPMRELYDQAADLRDRQEGEAWKLPFNRFRRAFTARHREAVVRLAAGDDDGAFWLAFMHFSIEPEA